MANPVIQSCEFVFGGQWKKHKDHRGSKEDRGSKQKGAEDHTSPDDVRIAEPTSDTPAPLARSGP